MCSTIQLPVSLVTKNDSSMSTADSQGSDLETGFACYVAAKSGSLGSYRLQVVDENLQIVAKKSDKVKSSVPLTDFHIKKDQKKPRQESNIVSEDSTDASPASQKFLYPVKLALKDGKSRQVYFATRKERKIALLAVLAAQGFESQLAQYEIISVLSDSSSNPVSLATHKLTGIKAAIKTVQSKDYARLTMENGISEAAAMGMFQKDNNTASLIEEFSIGKLTYIVTKFVKTGDLLGYLDERNINKLSESEARTLFKQIVSGVATYHAAGIAHRDIKHLNILISMKNGTPQPKITDFGMAARLQEGEMITKVAGTICFMAPEIVLEEPSDFKADVWSLGVMLYALLSSKVPFSGSDRQSTAELIVNGDLSFAQPIWKSVSDSAKDLLASMLEKEQDTRLSAQQVLEHPWFSEEI